MRYLAPVLWLKCKASPAEKLSAAGFRSAVPSARMPTTAPRHLLEAGRHIDWAFVQGPMEADKGKAYAGIKASDHYPISFDLTS